MEKLSALYASSLFEIALEGGLVDDFLEQAILLREALQDPDCRRALLHPHISAAEKRDFLSKALAGVLHGDFMSFLFLVVEKNREGYLLPALTALIERIERHQGKAIATVLSAVEFDEKQTTELKELLSKKLNKNVEVILRVDPSVIGGPYINVDGYSVDRTIKSQLRYLTLHMKERCGA